MTKLIKYVVEEPGVLTLTILLEDGKEVVVPISREIAEEMIEDIYATIYFKEDPKNYVPILKITRHIDPNNGAVVESYVEEERDTN